MGQLVFSTTAGLAQVDGSVRRGEGGERVRERGRSSDKRQRVVVTEREERVHREG